MHSDNAVDVRVCEHTYVHACVGACISALDTPVREAAVSPGCLLFCFLTIFGFHPWRFLPTESLRSERWGMGRGRDFYADHMVVNNVVRMYFCDVVKYIVSTGENSNSKTLHCTQHT